MYVNGKQVKSHFWRAFIITIIISPWILISLRVILIPLFIMSPTYFIEFVVGITCIIGMIICIKYMPKRNEYGTEILGKLKGFKNFLETAEKEKLEALVEKEPTYFYNILPYTYVLGVSSKWIKKFEDMNIEPPNWYSGYNDFNMHSFGSFMDSTMKSAQSVMSSSPGDSSSGGSFSSGGGGSSGGGSSGGGSGGGGGSSW